MRQNLTVYMKNGMRVANQALYKNKLFFKYSFFLLTSLIGKLFFITYPLFVLADIRLVRTVEETGRFEIEKSFEDSNSIKKVWTIILFILLKASVILTGIVVLSGITICLFYLGLIIDNMTTLSKYYIAPYILWLGVIAIILFIIMVNLILGPATYLIQINNGFGISDTLTKSVSIMKKNGKKRLLLIWLFHLLRITLNLIIYLGLIYYVYNVSSPLVFTFCSIGFGMILLLSFPKIILSKKIATISLFKDLIALDDFEDSLNYKDSQKLKKKAKKEDLLVTLFDDKVIEKITFNLHEDMQSTESGKVYNNNKNEGL